MNLYYTLVPKIIFSLGIINLVSGLLIFFSCRCLPGAPIGKWLMRYAWFQHFYKYHCRVWVVFWSSVAVHAVLALIYFGWPN